MSGTKVENLISRGERLLAGLEDDRRRFNKSEGLTVEDLTMLAFQADAIESVKRCLVELRGLLVGQKP